VSICVGLSLVIRHLQKSLYWTGCPACSTRNMVEVYCKSCYSQTKPIANQKR